MCTSCFKLIAKTDPKNYTYFISAKITLFKNIYFVFFLLICISIHSLVNQTMSNLDVGKVRQTLSEALDVWSRGSRLTFSEVYSKDADIQILFARYKLVTQCLNKLQHKNLALLIKNICPMIHMDVR